MPPELIALASGFLAAVAPFVSPLATKAAAKVAETAGVDAYNALKAGLAKLKGGPEAVTQFETAGAPPQDLPELAARVLYADDALKEQIQAFVAEAKGPVTGSITFNTGTIKAKTVNQVGSATQVNIKSR